MNDYTGPRLASKHGHGCAAGWVAVFAMLTSCSPRAWTVRCVHGRGHAPPLIRTG